MRSIFITLVVINVLVFVGQWFSRATPPAGGAATVARAPTVGGESLQLLAQVNQPKRASPSSPVNRPVSTTPSNGTGVMCTMVGPFALMLHAEYLVERLGAMDAEAEIRSIEIPAGIRYWVYLPPEMSEKQALRRLHEIQAKRIDSYIIPNGELTNGISLGMFSEEAAAQARLNEIRALGYQPEVREVARTINETWVTLPLTEADKIDSELWLDFLRQQPGLEKRQNYCLGVAPD